MRISLRTLALLAFAALALAGCGVENLDGITLATAAIRPTTTPPPTATPDPLAASLPNTATKEFLGTTITLSYPEDWQTDEGGQSLVVFDSEYPPGKPGTRQRWPERLRLTDAAAQPGRRHRESGGGRHAGVRPGSCR